MESRKFDSDRVLKAVTEGVQQDGKVVLIPPEELNFPRSVKRKLWSRDKKREQKARLSLCAQPDALPRTGVPRLRYPGQFRGGNTLR